MIQNAHGYDLVNRTAPTNTRSNTLRPVLRGAQAKTEHEFFIGISAKLLAIGIFLSGVLINPMNPAAVSKIIAADLFFLAGITLLLLASIKKSGILELRLHRNTHWFFQILAAFLMWVFLSGVVSIFVYDQRFGRFVQTFANYSYGAVICFAIVAASAFPGHLRMFLVAFILGVVLVSSFSALAMFAEAPAWVYHGGGRIKSTSQSVNQLAAFVAPAIPLALIFSLGRSASRKTTLFFFFASALAVIALIGTGSRTALVLLVVSLMLVLLGTLLFFASKVRLATTMLLFCVMATLALGSVIAAFKESGSSALPVLAQGLARPLDRFLNPDTVEAGLGPRYEQIVAVTSNWVNYPAFGIGPGNFKNYSSSTFEVHNTYLGTLIEIGVPGLIFLLLFQATICIAALKRALSRLAMDQRIQAFAVFSAFLIVCLYGMGSFGLRQRPFWVQAGFAIGVLNYHWLMAKRPMRRFN